MYKTKQNTEVFGFTPSSDTKLSTNNNKPQGRVTLCPGPPRTTPDYPDYPAPPRTTPDYPDYPAPPRTTPDYSELPRTTLDYPGLPRITPDYPGPPRITPDYPGLSRTAPTIGLRPSFFFCSGMFYLFFETKLSLRACFIFLRENSLSLRDWGTPFTSQPDTVGHNSDANDEANQAHTTVIIISAAAVFLTALDRRQVK